MADVNRSKRYIIFPPTSPTRVQVNKKFYSRIIQWLTYNFSQLIAGVGIPVELDFESVTLGYVFKAEYYVPDNTTLIMHFMQNPFNPITHPITSRRKRNAVVAPGPSEPHHTQDSIQIKTNKTDANSTFDNHYEKYNIEAIEIDRGNNIDEDDSEYYDDSSEEEDDGKTYTAADYRISKPNDFATARWSLFKGIEMLAERLFCLWYNLFQDFIN